MTLQEFIETTDLSILDLDDYCHLFILSPDGEILNPPSQQEFFLASPQIDKLYFECAFVAFAQVKANQKILHASYEIPLVNSYDKRIPYDKHISFRQTFNSGEKARESWATIKEGDTLLFAMLNDEKEFMQKVADRDETERRLKKLKAKERESTICYFSKMIPARVALDFKLSIKQAEKEFFHSMTYILILDETALFNDYSLNDVYNIYKYERENGDPLDSPQLKYVREYCWIHY